MSKPLEASGEKDAASEPSWSVYLKWTIIICFAVYAVLRTARSVNMLFGVEYDMHDIRLIYNTWKQFVVHKTAGEPMETLTYLPYVWWGLTPIFCLGWPATRIIWAIVNFALAFYTCYRLGNLLALDFFKRCALLIFFFSLLGTGLVIGLGNLAMTCLAAMLAAFPFQTRLNSFWLIPAAFKHSLSYPIYLFLLIRRPKKVVLPLAILSLMIVLSMLWAGAGLHDLLMGLKNGQAISKVWMHENTTVSLMPIFEGLLGETALAQIVNWACWFTLFGIALARLRDPLILLATLMLLSLLPMHHRNYDMIVVAPALAVFLKYCRFIWPILVTLSLAGINDHLEGANYYGSPALKLLIPFYYPSLILVFLAGLFIVDHQLCRQKSVEIKG